MAIRFINELIYAQDLFYSRKNYKRPELQQEPHRTFADEATLLDAMFHGNHYLFFLFIDFVAEISLVCVVYWSSTSLSGVSIERMRTAADVNSNFSTILRMSKWQTKEA